MSDEKPNKDFENGFYKVRLGVTRKELSLMRDEPLASWQESQKTGSAQYILADQEWQSRRLGRQIRAMYGVAIVGIAGVVLGVILGWYLRSFDSKIPVAANNQAETQTESENENKPPNVKPQGKPPIAPPIMPSSPSTNSNDPIGQQHGGANKP